MRRFLTDLYLEEAPQATHRIVVRLAAVGSAFCAIVLAAIGLWTGNSDLFPQAIGPSVAAVLFVVHIVTKRENATIVLLEAMLVVLLSFGLWGSSDTVLAALLAAWVFCLSGAFFVVRRPVAYIAVTSLLLAVLPTLWSDEIEAPAVAGLTMFTAYLLTVTLLFLIRRSSARSDARFERLFDAAPVALMEQDVSGALGFIRSCGIHDEQSLRSAIDDMQFLRDVVSRIRVVRANAKAIRLSGITARELVDFLPPDRVHADSAHAFREQIMASWLGKPRLEIEYRTRRFNGLDHVWLRIEMMSMEVSPHSKRILLAVTDVTEARDARAALEDLVRSKDEFIASVSHELRTPLTGVLGLTTALADGAVSDAKEVGELLEMVRSQSQEISYLVEDLLVGARAEIGTIAIRPVDVDLGVELNDVLKSLDLGSVPVDLDSDVRCFADSVRVRQIMRNLVVNAERYGGPLRRAVLRRSGDDAVFEMWDNGPAIPEDAQQRIFEPYGRAHRKEGTTASVGLGLSVSRQLAHLMGGSLEYLYDDGSVFRLTLPGSSGTVAARRDQGEHAFST